MSIDDLRTNKLMMDQRKYLPDRLAANFGKFLIIAILLIGIGLRFFNLEQKVYSADGSSLLGMVR